MMIAFRLQICIALFRLAARCSLHPSACSLLRIRARHLGAKTVKETAFLRCLGQDIRIPVGASPGFPLKSDFYFSGVIEITRVPGLALVLLFIPAPRRWTK